MIINSDIKTKYIQLIPPLLQHTDLTITVYVYYVALILQGKLIFDSNKSIYIKFHI